MVLSPHLAEEDKSGLGPLTDHFSDGDLNDMLNFFEKPEPGEPDSACPAASTERSSSSGSDAQRGAHSAVSSPARAQGTNATGMFINGLMGMPAAAQIPSSATAVVALNGHLFAVPQPQQLSAQYDGYDTSLQHTAHFSSSRDNKTTISHSTIEKQRRDRINSLIDELRDLVPASAAMKGPDGSDMKRPKHVVLSDTISLLRHMKDRAPCNLPASVGVLVEEGPGCFLVKVNCKDRRGLLSDITSAIRSLPLQITRAAITTSEAGAVYDVFEIVVEPGLEMEGVSALDVQFQVHQALYKWRMGRGNSSDGSQEVKRRRSDE
eukprot:gene5994-6232_t